MNTIDQYNEFCAAQRSTGPILPLGEFVSRKFTGISHTIATVRFFDEANREYVVTADVERGGTVSLWTGPNDLDIDELATALDCDPGFLLDALRCAALEGSL